MDRGDGQWSVSDKLISIGFAGINLTKAVQLAKAEGCDAFVSIDKEFAATANGLNGIKVRAP